MATYRKKPPDELNPEAAAAWRRFGGKIDPVDAAAMILLCQAWAEMAGAQKEIEKKGAIIKLPNHCLGPNPQCKARDTARACVMKLLKEFGFTPASRAKIAAAAEVDDDPGELEI